MSLTDPGLRMPPPWQVRLNFAGGQTRYEVRSHVAPSVVLDAAYWPDGDTGPTDAHNYLLHDEHADVRAHRVRLGWMLAAAPAMRRALQQLLAADAPERLAAAQEQARDALALAALPVGDPDPPPGGSVEAVSLNSKEGSREPIPDTRTVAGAAAHMAEFGPRRFTLSMLAFTPAGEMECQWDADAGGWSPWKPIR